MKSKLNTTPIKKNSVNFKTSKLDERELKKTPNQKNQDNAEKFDRAESAKEIQTGENQGDFPPDIYDNDTANREAVNIRQH